MKKYLAVLLMVGFSLATKAQELSDYKYIIVPAKFDFQKEPGQYDTNALSKFLFQKYGFNAFISTEQLPDDYNASGCNSLVMTVEEGGFLSTKVVYTLSDCRGQVVYTSPEGKSKIKEFKPAYDEALREAMTGLEELGYTYSDEIFAITEVASEDMAMDQAKETRSAKMPQRAEEVKSKSRMDKMPKRAENEVKETQTSTPSMPAEDKTVIVQAVPMTTNPKPAVREQKETNKTTQAIAEAEKRSNAKTPSPSAAQTAKMYKSVDGSYSLKANSTGFDLYEDGNQIGSAKKTSGNSYLVSSSQFVGVGTLEGDTFIIEREIKGVQGLVKMAFKSADQ